MLSGKLPSGGGEFVMYGSSITIKFETAESKRKKKREERLKKLDSLKNESNNT